MPRRPPPSQSRLPELDDEEAMPTSIFSSEEVSQISAFKPAYLYVERGPGAGQLVPIKQGQLVVGRASISDLRLQHASVSRRHAQITREGERIFVRDLGSQNGTYVNRTKIVTEIEVQLGDQVAVGNAVLVLRGSAQGLPQLDASVGGRERRPPRRLWISLVAGAAGFALAGLVVFALVKVTGAPPEDEMLKLPPPPEARTTPEPRTPPPTRAAEKAKTLAAEARAAERTERAERAAERKAAESASASETGTEAPKTTRRAVAAAQREREREPAATETVEKPSSSGRAPSGRKAILQKYEEGDVAAAIEMAEEAEDTEISDKLIKFERLNKEAQAALSGRDGVVAIRSLGAAVRADEAISKGKGAYAAELKEKLSKLWVLVGLKHLEGEKTEEAKKAFSAALKYDPKNSQAEEELQKLSGDEGATKAPKPANKKTASDAIDAAFGD